MLDIKALRPRSALLLCDGAVPNQVSVGSHVERDTAGNVFELVERAAFNAEK